MIDIGPGRVMTRLVRDTAPHVTVRTANDMLATPMHNQEREAIY
jgi:malonyl CoA-acyl carrier protein transacylase